MDNLNELSVRWQNHLNEENKMDFLIQDEGIIFKLKKLQKKQFRINLAKTMGVSISLIFLSLMIMNNAETSLLIKIALGWIILSILIGMIIYWKKQYNPSALDYSARNLEFIENTIQKLEEQKSIVQILLPVLVTSLILGLNLIYFDLLKSENIGTRILLHSGATLFLIIVMQVGLKVRKQRFNNEFKPLIDELKTIRQNLISNGLF